MTMSTPIRMLIKKTPRQEPQGDDYTPSTGPVMPPIGKMLASSRSHGRDQHQK